VTSIDLTIWAPIIATWNLVVGTLGLAYWQLRQASRLHSASTLLDLRERFYSDRMRQARRELAGWMLKSDRGPEVDNWEVGIFLEMIGFLTRTGVLEKRMVWSAFGTWITAYWTLMKQPVDLVSQWRSESRDPTIFREYEWLAEQMFALDRKLVGARGPTRTPLEDAREVLESETHLDSASSRPR
jgi:hypothetical protein